MANVAEIKDESLRAQLESANAHLRNRNPSDAVRACVDAFVAMIEQHPELVSATTPGRRGQQPLVFSWPQLGASFEPGSLRDGAPKPVFSKERFAVSEAITYYEFVVETAIRQGL